ncbi:MAG TPA: hypothetical protein VIG42_10035 [Solirubrobacteraceae bacterium]
MALPGQGGSTLVLDRDAATLCDRRLLAHLARDEPAGNAALVCARYLEDANGRWCRRVQARDLLVDPLDPSHHGSQALDGLDPPDEPVDEKGVVYRLLPLPGERSAAQLRWCRRPGGVPDSDFEQVALREVIAVFESYEPMRTLTEEALARQSDEPKLLVTRLRSEFERLCASPIVLNRGLREAVLNAIDARGLSMSEIAVRCGMVKRDRHGRTSGETSWVARRIGVMPEGGETEVTPWVHIEVLALIARKGLGISPREVEVQ